MSEHVFESNRSARSFFGSKKVLTLCLFLGSVAVTVSVQGQTSVVPDTLLCIPGELLFSEEFDPKTVSDRWWYKADFALRDGALLRTNVAPNESRRVFLKDPAFHNTIVQFDFKLSGKTTDLRLVTGSNGGYNSITQIRPDHFQVNTPVDRDAGLVPAHLGECVRKSRPNEWQTMTVEYWDDQMVAHLCKDEFVVGKHPIIDRTRDYFAFQFDLPGAAIDNVRVWRANGERDGWSSTRKTLIALQANRAVVSRNPADRYKYEYTNLKSRLTLTDQTYRGLVATHNRLNEALHADYATAFASHKELGKRLAYRKKKIKETEPKFKLMENAVHKSRRAEDTYVLSTAPSLLKFQGEGFSRQQFVSELGQVRDQLEAAGDSRLAALVDETAGRQRELEACFPEAFQRIDDAVNERKHLRKKLNLDPRFKARNRAVADAQNALKDYERESDPTLVELETASKAYLNARKMSAGE